MLTLKYHIYNDFSESEGVSIIMNLRKWEEVKAESDCSQANFQYNTLKSLQ